MICAKVWKSKAIIEKNSNPLKLYYSKLYWPGVSRISVFLLRCEERAVSSLVSLGGVCMLGHSQKAKVFSRPFWVSAGDWNGPSEDGKCIQVPQPTLPGQGLQNQPSIQHGFPWIWLSPGRTGHRSLYHRSGNQMWPVPWAGNPPLTRV